MISQEYKLTFFLNATHQVCINTNISSIHPHTFEIKCWIQANHLIPFENIEDRINGILRPLDNKYLNDLEVFKGTNPTLENIAMILFELFKPQIQTFNAKLLRMEVAESPVRSFIVTDK